MPTGGAQQNLPRWLNSLQQLGLQAQIAFQAQQHTGHRQAQLDTRERRTHQKESSPTRRDSPQNWANLHHPDDAKRPTPGNTH